MRECTMIKQLSNLMFFYAFFTIPITYSMLQRRVYDVTCTAASFLYGTYTNTQRYFEKKVNPDLTKAILGLEDNRQEKLKNNKVYLALKQYIELQEKPDCYPEGVSLHRSHNDRIINQEYCRVALSRGPFAVNYLTSLLNEKSDLDPYNKVVISNKLLKNHAASFLYGLYFIVLTGNNGEILMKKKFLDNEAIVTDNTKLSLLRVLISFLIEETNSINELLFQVPDKQNLAHLISSLTTIYSKIAK